MLSYINGQRIAILEKQDILITKDNVFTTIDSIMAEFTPQDASYYPWIGWYLF